MLSSQRDYGFPEVSLLHCSIHCDKLEKMLTVSGCCSQDLAACIAALKENPNCVKGGSAAIYGATCSMPDRRIVGELLETYQDAMLTP